MTTKKTASETKKKASKSKTELCLSFPLAADWKALVERFHLDKAQAQNLQLLLQQVINDLDHFRSVMKQIPQRSNLVARLKRLEVLFSLVSSELKKAEKDLPHLLPHNTGAFIGKAMTFTALSDAIGKDQFPISVDLEIERMINATKKIGQKTIESFGEPRREAFGIAQSHILLPYIINGIYEPLRVWIELDRKNKGGRAPNLLRRYLAYWLVYEAKTIFGREPTISQFGKFVEFAEAVFEACRLPTLGLDKILPGIVKQVREDKKLNGGKPVSPETKLQLFVEEPR